MGKIFRTGEVTPTKIGLQSFLVNLYLHEFFEPILFFDPHGLYIAHGPKGNFGRFEGKRIMGKIFRTGEVTPIEIGLQAFLVNLYLREFFEPILFFDPHGL